MLQPLFVLLFIVLMPLLAAPLLAATIQAGTRFEVRLDRTVSSRDAEVGVAIACSLSSDLVVDGRVLARAGHPLRARVTYVRHSGRFHHAGYITVQLSSIDIEGEHYELESSPIRDKGNGHTSSHLEKIGGGTGIGGIIGAIAGGCKGALIGGLLGAGGGTTVAATTGRQPAELKAESVYDLRLENNAHGRR
ncbi:MAG: hypothetical protein ACRYFU_02230 [Janthinobacterium lividum]